MSDHNSRAIPLDEGRLSDRVRPLVRGNSDFDWAEVERALGECDDLGAEDRVKLAQALAVIVRWSVGPLAHAAASGRASSRAERTVARTMLVLAWTLNAETFDGQSLEQIAATLRINLRHLRELRSEVLKRFGQLRIVY